MGIVCASVSIAIYSEMYLKKNWRLYSYGGKRVFQQGCGELDFMPAEVLPLHHPACSCLAPSLLAVAPKISAVTSRSPY